MLQDKVVTGSGDHNMDILVGSFLDLLCLLIKIEPQMIWGRIRRRFTHRVEEMVNKGFVFYFDNRSNEVQNK